VLPPDVLGDGVLGDGVLGDGVLPDGPDGLVAGIAAELRWARKHLTTTEGIDA
jgi:hypothetical protein